MSGAGKTTACNEFIKHGFVVINCDEVARKHTTENLHCLYEIKERFSESIINEEGKLDRKKTSSIIFNDKEKKSEFENILFPYIMYSVISQIQIFANNGNNEILLDAPTLYESGANALCTKVVSIITDIETSVQRITERDGISVDEARIRIASQHNEDFYRQQSDYIIPNNNNIHEFKKNISEIIDILLFAEK